MPSLYPGLLAAWYDSFLLPLQNGSQGLAKDTSWDVLWEHNSWSAKQENVSRGFFGGLLFFGWQQMEICTSGRGREDSRDAHSGAAFWPRGCSLRLNT